MIVLAVYAASLGVGPASPSVRTAAQAPSVGALFSNDFEAPLVRAKPKTVLQALIDAEDYPAAALRAGQQGIVKVVLNVNAVGRVTDCAIIKSSGSALLDASTCRLLTRRARFMAGRDQEGRTTADRVEYTQAWYIPDR